MLDFGIAFFQGLNLLLFIAFVVLIVFLVKVRFETAARIERIEKLLEEISQNLKHHKNKELP